VIRQQKNGTAIAVLCCMKRICVLLVTLLVAGTSFAQRDGFGIGIMAGDPTGLNGKYWLAGDRALTFGLAWGPWGRNLHLHGDFTFQNLQLVKDADVQLDLYYGLGMRLRSWNNGGRYWRGGRWYEDGRGSLGIGMRIPVGAAMTVDGLPLDFFLEVVPTLELIPATYLDLDVALGVRYWF
jgi:hypothetical protein